MIDGETVIRVGHGSHVRPGQGLPSSEPGVKSAFQRSTPGILIFSRKRQLVHMNRRALELTGHFHQTEQGPVNEIRSAPVHDLRFHIQEALDRRSAANIWELFELKRFIFEAGRKILVRGFGLLDRNSHNDSRIVIVLEEAGHQEEDKAQQAPARVFPSKNRRAAS
jgi:PAS domain-containing protein